MKPLKYVRLLWIVLVIGVLAFTACTSDTSETDVPDETAEETTEVNPTADTPEVKPTEAAGPVEFSFWHIHEEWWSDYTAQFNEEHPNVTVKLEVFETEPYKPKISSAMIAGTEPCIFYQIPGPETETWLREGKVIKIGDVLDANRFVPAARDGCTSGGDFVCMPFYLSPSFFYYNKSMFAEAGVDPATWADPMQPTWDEFLAAGEALKAAGHVPIALGNADNWPGLFFYWATQEPVRRGERAERRHLGRRCVHRPRLYQGRGSGSGPGRPGLFPGRTQRDWRQRTSTTCSRRKSAP